VEDNRPTNMKIVKKRSGAKSCQFYCVVRVKMHSCLSLSVKRSNNKKYSTGT